MRILTFALLLTAVALPCQAQSLSSVQIGDRLSSLEAKIGFAPDIKNRQGPMQIQKWTFADGNALSVTADAETGKVVYCEAEWGGQVGGSISDFPGFSYGKTTLTDIRKHFGSNGMAYAARGGVAATRDGGVVFLNSWEVKSPYGQVATFVTKISPSRFAAAKKSKNGPGDFAVLDSVILADPAYVDRIWGKEKTFDPTYSAINWR